MSAIRELVEKFTANHIKRIQSSTVKRMPIWKKKWGISEVRLGGTKLYRKNIRMWTSYPVKLKAHIDKELPEHIRQSFNDLLPNLQQEGQSMGTRMAPFKTGHLAQSIEVSTWPYSEEGEGVELRIRGRARYTGFQEYGWTPHSTKGLEMVIQGFITPAQFRAEGGPGHVKGRYFLTDTMDWMTRYIANMYAAWLAAPYIRRRREVWAREKASMLAERERMIAIKQEQYRQQRIDREATLKSHREARKQRKRRETWRRAEATVDKRIERMVGAEAQLKRLKAGKTVRLGEVHLPSASERVNAISTLQKRLMLAGPGRPLTETSAMLRKPLGIGKLATGRAARSSYGLDIYNRQFLNLSLDKRMKYDPNIKRKKAFAERKKWLKKQKKSVDAETQAFVDEYKTRKKRRAITPKEVREYKKKYGKKGQVKGKTLTDSAVRHEVVQKASRYRKRAVHPGATILGYKNQMVKFSVSAKGKFKIAVRPGKITTQQGPTKGQGKRGPDQKRRKTRSDKGTRGRRKYKKRRRR